MTPYERGVQFLDPRSTPTLVIVFQAGGGGLYSAVFPSWGAGPHGNPWVNERIELDQARELP